MSSMSHTQIWEWFRHFKTGHVSIESDPCSDGLQQQKLPKMWNVKILINQNNRLTVSEIDQDLGVSKTTVLKIVRDLGMCHITTIFVPQLLTEDQKNYRVEIPQRSVERCLRNVQKGYYWGWVMGMWVQPRN